MKTDRQILLSNLKKAGVPYRRKCGNVTIELEGAYYFKYSYDKSGSVILSASVQLEDWG